MNKPNWHILSVMYSSGIGAIPLIFAISGVEFTNPIMLWVCGASYLAVMCYAIAGAIK